MQKYYQIRPNKKSNSISNLIARTSVTAQLIIFTSTFSLVSFFLFSFLRNSINYLALNPSHILQGDYIWTLLTHMFVHGGIIHLIINMIVLSSLGSLCERIIGRKRFLGFYILSGLFAGILSVALSAQFGSTLWGERIFGSPD